jgi:UDP-glucose 4-epimerase
MSSAESVLVTGTSGFLGALIAVELLLRGYQVLGLDILPPKNEVARSTEFAFYQADITRPETLPLEIRRASILVHCAALVHHKSTDLSRDDYFLVNCAGARNILRALDPSRLRRIIFLSTVSVYGNVKSGIVPDERTPLEPVDFYGESKVAAEEEVRLFCRQHAVRHTIFRIAPVFGPGFLLNLEKRVCLPGRMAFYRIGNGQQRLSLVAADNVVQAVCECLSRGIGTNDTFNLKDKENYSLNDIIDALRRLYKKPSLPVIGIPRLVLFGTAAGLQWLAPQKGAFLSYQLNKVSGNAIYSGDKLLTAGIDLPWDLMNTLFRN